MAPEFTERLLKILPKVPHAFHHVAASRWISELEFQAFALPVSLPRTFVQMLSMITAQENTCRHCYGASRALLKFEGLSEDQITQLEHALALGELDAAQQLSLRFCRRLATSIPPPAKEDRDALERAGTPPERIAEMAAVVAVRTVSNRICTLLAVPIDTELEEKGRLFQAVARFLKLEWSAPKPSGPVQDQTSSALPPSPALTNVSDRCAAS